MKKNNTAVYMSHTEGGKRESVDDAALVARAISGDLTAFDRLMHRHAGRCYRLARHFGLSEEDAADAVQDAFFSAWRSLDRFDFSWQFSTWLTRILINRMSNLRRGLRRAARYFFRPQTEAQIAHVLRQHQADDPQQELETQETQQLVRKAIETLPAGQKTVLILFELEGYRIRDIAVMLDIPEGTVSSRLHKARLQLRRELQAHIKGNS